MYGAPPEQFDLTPEIEKLAAAYPAERAKARKAGIPLSVKEFKRPFPPDAENAATIYTRLTALKRLTEEDKLADFLSQNPVTSAQVEEANRLFARCDAPLRLAHAVVARPKCVFKWDWDSERPATIVMPELAETRRCARLLTAESCLMAYKDDARQAIRNQMSAFQIARHAFSAPLLLGWLAGIAMEAIALSGLRRILLVHPDAETARAVTTLIGPDWKTLSLASAIGGETAFDQSILDRGRRIGFLPFLVELNNDSGGFTSEPDATAREREAKQAYEKMLHLPSGTAIQRQNRILFDGWGTFLLRQMMKLHTAADLPYLQAKPVFESVRRDMEPPSKPDNRTVVLLVPSLVVPVFTVTIQQKARVEAQAATLRAGAAVLAYRASNKGRLPDSLPGLFPDPFTGKQLGYRKEPGAKGTGFVIYSVGADGKFDGGRPGNPVPAKSRTLLFRFAP